MKIGDYVTATLVNGDEARQGVYVKDNRDGTIQIQEEGEAYQCIKARCVVVPDSNLWGDTRVFVQNIRRQLGC